MDLTSALQHTGTIYTLNRPNSSIIPVLRMIQGSGIPVAPVAYQVILKPGIGQFRELV